MKKLSKKDQAIVAEIKQEVDLQNTDTETLKQMYLTFDWKNRDSFDACLIAGELHERGVEISEKVVNGIMVVTFPPLKNLQELRKSA